MADDPTADASQAVPFSLTLSGDPQLSQVARDLYARVASQMGYSESMAQAIGHAVERMASALIARGLGTDGSVDIACATSDAHLEIEVRCPSTGDPGAGTVGTLETALGESIDGEVPLALMRHAMGQVEFSAEAGVEVCRLRRPLPPS